MRVNQRYFFVFLALAIAGAVVTAVVMRLARPPTEDRQLAAQAARLGGPAVPAALEDTLVRASTYNERARILDERWSAWPAFGSAKDRSTVEGFCSALLSSSRGEEATLQQREALGTFLTDLLHGNAIDEPSAHLRRLASTGEIFDQQRIDARRKFLTESAGVPASQLQDPVEVVLRSRRADGYESYIDQLVLGEDDEGSRVEFDVISSRPTQRIGDQLMALTGHVQAYHAISTPPRTLDEALREEGKLLTAIVHVFVRKPKDRTGATQPLIMRLWYDTKYGTWRRAEILTFPMRKQEASDDLWSPVV